MASTQLAPLLALTGRMHSGKTTIAELLATRWWQVWRRPVARVRFAEALKRALLAMGLDARHVDGDLKDEPCAMLGGQTPRWAMQSLGTDWGRKLIHPDLWVELAMRRANQLRRAGVGVVIDDCRFDNEAEAVVAAGGRVVQLVRVDAEARPEDVIVEALSQDGAHASERGVSPALVDTIVPNYFARGPRRTAQTVRDWWRDHA